jgi:prepilin-type N-terminal cleavage/methylation domain-containing protein
MKRKAPAFVRQVPIDFGDELLLTIPIRKSAATFRNGHDAPGIGDFSNGARKAILKPGNLKLKIQNSKLGLNGSSPGTRHPSPRKRGFTLVEILVVLVLLSLIVFALMAVFSGTQRAFRASLTWSDTLEGGRAVMDLITGDLETMTPSDYNNSYNANVSFANPLGYAPVNFYVIPKAFPAATYPPSPLLQSLIGSSTPNVYRTNVLEDIFILSKGSINGVPTWIGTGYSVNTNLPDGTLYPLYRFYMTSPASAGPTGEALLYTNFIYFNYTNSAQWSHLMDGVVNLTARTYDTNGVWMTNGYANPNIMHVRFAVFQPTNFTTETYCAFYSNALPASVQIELGTIEDHVLEHAQGLSGVAQSNYLANSAGQVHVFRQRVWIHNLDTSAYQ